LSNGSGLESVGKHGVPCSAAEISLLGLQFSLLL
jgi:hypothetical protein